MGEHSDGRYIAYKNTISGVWAVKPSPNYRLDKAFGFDSLSPRERVRVRAYSKDWHTLDKFPTTSSFLNLIIEYPFDLRISSRTLSYLFRLSCTHPSISTINLSWWQQKSATKPSTTCCRRNLNPKNRLFLRISHIIFSSSVSYLLSCLANTFLIDFMNINIIRSNFPSKSGQECQRIY